MSGHSKWSSIKHKKGAADKKRSAIFTRVTRDIIVAAKDGGGDPAMNFKLRMAIDKAKAANMPKDNIERAIKKGTGEDKDDVVFEEVTYEGFGPAQAAVMVVVMTDNRNRSSAEVKHVFTKNGGNMGGPGSVAWQFEHVAAAHISADATTGIADRDEFELAMIDAGATDILEEDDGLVVYAEQSGYQKIMEALESSGITVADSGLEWRAKDTIQVAESDKEKVQQFFEALDDCDDVQAWFTNAQ